MKNMKKIMIVVCLVFLTTGCGGKKLTCTYSNDAGKMTIVFSFDKNDKVEQAILTNVQEIDDSLSEDEINKEIKEAKKHAKDDYDDYDDFDIKRDGNKLITKAKVNSKDKLGYLTKENYDYDSIKSFVDKDKNFTCK